MHSHAKKFIPISSIIYVPTPADYEEYRKKGLKENERNFDIDADFVKKKIRRFVEFNPEFTEEEVRTEIFNSNMFRSFFLKDPIRQNMYEVVFADYTKKIDGVRNFGKPDALYVSEGNLVTKKELKAKKLEAETKSIDFYWEYNNKKIYAYHKYAKEPGGHQDNQYEDLLKFIQACINIPEKNSVFLAIADGEYFNSIDGKVGKTRIQNLRDTGNNSNVFGLTSEEIKDVFTKL